MQNPDWNFWREMPEVELWQAVALSLDLEPDAIHQSELFEWSWETERFPKKAWRGSEPLTLTASETFSKRLRLLYANLRASHKNSSIKGSFTTIPFQPYQTYTRPVYLSEFAAWGLKVGFDMPPELVEMAKPYAKSDTDTIQPDAARSKACTSRRANEKTRLDTLAERTGLTPLASSLAVSEY